MSDDYFGDTSDADFLALTQHLDRSGDSTRGNKTGSTSSANATTRPTASKHGTSAPTISRGSTERRQPEPSKANQATHRVLRPGFNTVIVNTRQKGNPVLEHIKNVPWEYGDILPDFVLGATTCALFLSLRYHRLHPEYIYNRIQKLGREYNLRILLVMDNHSDPLRELTKTSLVNDFTIILAWSAAEAGRYLETYKAFEHASSNLIKQHQATDYPTRLIETLTTVRSVNKNDAISLVTNFGSLSRALNAPSSQIAMLGGWGPQKIERLEKTVSEPFIIKTGSGGAIGLGKKLEGGRWMLDQEGADVLDEMEVTYANAGIPQDARSLPQRPMEDERMPDEWNRGRDRQSEVVAFMGRRPIVRPGSEMRGEAGVESGGGPDANGQSGVMAALARLRQH